MSDWTYPIPEHRRSVYKFYGLTFAADGCPMKRMEHGDVFHPIFPAYLINDYLRWYLTDGDEHHLALAKSIAKLALARAERRGDALVFVYPPESKLTQFSKPFYSALTQAWYIKAFAALHPYLDLAEPLRAIFRSLLIPIEQDGCLVAKAWGWTVEEYPHAPPLYTLNGWLTVLRWLCQARATLDEVGVDIEHFLDRNYAAVRHLLPLYDAEFCANSRYQLTGFTRLKLVLGKNTRRTVRSFALTIPGEGTFAGSLEKGRSRWTNYVERDEGRVIQLCVVQSLVSYPEPNVLSLSCDIDKPCVATLYAAEGHYRPDASSIPATGWREVGRVDLISGHNELRLPISWDSENLFAYPTNFKKNVDGKFFNAYHYVHIADLAELYAASGIGLFKQYAQRWLRVTRTWPNLPSLQSDQLSFLPITGGERFPEIVEKLLVAGDALNADESHA
jgi:hypothetical protein